MIEIRTYVCPQCSTSSGIDSLPLAHTELAGAETWGECPGCLREYQLTADRRRHIDFESMIETTRSPIAWNLMFSMWRPRLR